MKIAWGIVMAGSLISGCTFVESCARVGRSVDWSIADAQKISDAQETSAKGEDAKPLELSAFEMASWTHIILLEESGSVTRAERS